MARAKKRNDKHSAELDMQSAIMRDGAPFSVVEAYRAIRTNIRYLNIPDTARGKVIAITSANAQEGKSVNAYNIALMMAQSGQNVLLVDADMRSPLITRYFKATLEPEDDEISGLSEYLARIEKSVIYQCGNLSNFSILPAGRTVPNPAELLSSKQTKQLFSQIKEQYDYIFVDTPPINVVSDALILSEFVDRYIIVVRSVQSDVEEIKRTVSALESVKAEIAGFLLNDLDKQQGAYKSGYKRYSRYNRYNRYNH